MKGTLLQIHDLFLLRGGTTVIACDKPNTDHSWTDRKVGIVSNDGEKRQELIVLGRRLMARQGVHPDHIALETQMPVELSVEEAQSGRWLIEA